MNCVSPTARLIASCVLLVVTVPTFADDWPQWRGPNRDGVVAAANVPASWPEKPTVQWTAKTGEGYSTPVVAEGRIFVHSRQEPDEIVTALDLATGKQLWTVRYPSSFTKNKYANDMSKGPFSTPLVANGVVYTLGTSAVLSAFDAATGAVKWRKDWSKEIDTSKLFTGTAMSPILDSGVLVVHVGDDGEGALRAFDPATGAEKWSLPGHGPGYASPVVATLGGVRQLVTMSDKAVLGVAVADGRQLWTIPFPDEWNENIVTPVVAGDILIVSGIRKGTLGYRVGKASSGLAATQVWHNPDLPMYMSSPVTDGSFLYGFSNKRKGQLFCLDAKTGAMKWTTEGRSGANASLQSAGANLLVLTTEGDLIVARLSPDKFDELRRYKVADSQTWAQPVLLKDGLIVRTADGVTRWKL
jgi:outer membrane protein assembly factor BamB